jgi:hypothetical protein
MEMEKGGRARSVAVEVPTDRLKDAMENAEVA